MYYLKNNTYLPIRRITIINYCYFPNIIVMIIAKNNDKNITEQKEICKQELLSRGYTHDIIDEWIEYI